MELLSSEALPLLHNDSTADGNHSYGQQSLASPFSSVAWTAIQVLVMTLFSVSGTFGNTLTIVAVFKTTKLQTIPNYFIVNLAAADLIVCLLLEPVYICTIIYQGCFLSQRLCQMVAVAAVTSMGASVLSMVVIAINRSINITKPAQIYKDVYTKTKTMWMCAAIWLLPLTFSLLFLMPVKFAELQYNPVILSCTLVPSVATTNVVLIFNMMSLGICYCIVLTCYIKIYKVVHQNRNRVCDLENQPKPGTSDENPTPVSLCSRAKQMELQVAANLLIIFVLFSICLYPYMVVSSLGASIDIHSSMGSFVMMLAYAHSSVNCIIYACRNKVYREAYYRILTRKY
ncbi:melatonin receptor type 1A-like [Ptychodera flava]|uniref:melatonin receptor type 1A-like n=1 Tax=Ptychodera flava TaxID=63121 RepID=UPI00396A60B1